MTSTPKPDADGEVWRSFKQLLDSPAPITLPPDTMYGAISHFLATRPLDALPGVVDTIIGSESLWKTGPRGREVRDAVRLAVSTKQQAVREALTKAYFPAYRERKQLQHWLTAVGKALVKSQDSAGRTQVLLGLVEGVQDVPEMEWGDTKDALEDELVVAVAGHGEAAGLSAEQLDMACAMMAVVHEHRLKVLNIEATGTDRQQMAHRLQRDLITRLGSQRGDNESTENRARALGRVLQCLDRGEAAERVNAWEIMQATCNDLHRLAAQSLISGAAPALIALRAMVNIIAASAPPSLPSNSRITAHPSVQVASSIIATLSDLVQHTSGEAQSLEDFQPVLYGCLDVVEAKGGEEGSDHLIRQICNGTSSRSQDRAAFVLTVGEQLINRISASILRDSLLLLTQRYLREPEHSASFEAAHAFCLAMIKAFIGIPVRGHAQDDFMREFIPAYARSLLKLAAEMSITADQLRAAYPIVCNGAGHVDYHALSSCVELMLNDIHRTDTASPFAQTLRLTRIAVTPSLPFDELDDYLERLAWNILDTPVHSVERSELVDAAFEMVVKDLPDEGKRTGMEWWLRWQRAMSGHNDQVSAKL